MGAMAGLGRFLAGGAQEILARHLAMKERDRQFEYQKQRDAFQEERALNAETRAKKAEDLDFSQLFLGGLDGPTLMDPNSEAVGRIRNAGFGDGFLEQDPKIQGRSFGGAFAMGDPGSSLRPSSGVATSGQMTSTPGEVGQAQGLYAKPYIPLAQRIAMEKMEYQQQMALLNLQRQYDQLGLQRALGEGRLDVSRAQAEASMARAEAARQSAQNAAESLQIRIQQLMQAGDIANARFTISAEQEARRRAEAFAGPKPQGMAVDASEIAAWEEAFNSTYATSLRAMLEQGRATVQNPDQRIIPPPQMPGLMSSRGTVVGGGAPPPPAPGAPPAPKRSVYTKAGGLQSGH